MKQQRQPSPPRGCTNLQRVVKQGIQQAPPVIAAQINRGQPESTLFRGWCEGVAAVLTRAKRRSSRLSTRSGRNRLLLWRGRRCR